MPQGGRILFWQQRYERRRHPQPRYRRDRGARSIRVVDDEVPMLEVFTQALGARFDVTTAKSAREAEFALRKKSFKVIVCDHLMPGGNGMSLLVRAGRSIRTCSACW